MRVREIFHSNLKTARFTFHAEFNINLYQHLSNAQCSLRAHHAFQAHRALEEQLLTCNDWLTFGARIHATLRLWAHILLTLVRTSHSTFRDFESTMVVETFEIFMILFLCIVNRSPCVALDMQSASIWSVGQYSTCNIPLSSGSFIKKCLMLMCRVLLWLLAFPFLSNWIALALSCWRLTLVSYPCSCRNMEGRKEGHAYFRFLSIGLCLLWWGGGTIPTFFVRCICTSG